MARTFVTPHNNQAFDVKTGAWTTQRHEQGVAQLASNNNQWIQWDNEGKILSLDASSLGRVANF